VYGYDVADYGDVGDNDGDACGYDYDGCDNTTEYADTGSDVAAAAAVV